MIRFAPGYIAKAVSLQIAFVLMVSGIAFAETALSEASHAVDVLTSEFVEAGFPIITSAIDESEETTPEETIMKCVYNYPKFSGPVEFFGELGAVMLLIMQNGVAIKRMDPVFRETVCLTVTYANNCRV